MVLHSKKERLADNLPVNDVTISFKLRLQSPSQRTGRVNQLHHFIDGIAVASGTSVGEAINHQADPGKKYQRDAKTTPEI